MLCEPLEYTLVQLSRTVGVLALGVRNTLLLHTLVVCYKILYRDWIIIKNITNMIHRSFGTKFQSFRQKHPVRISALDLGSFLELAWFHMCYRVVTPERAKTGMICPVCMVMPLYPISFQPKLNKTLNTNRSSFFFLTGQIQSWGPELWPFKRPK